MEHWSEINYMDALEVVGTFVFAISGIRLARGKDIDLFGAYMIGLATAIGGGTTRDILLGVTPFWMLDATYMIVTAVALVSIVIFKDRLFKWGRTLFLFDSIGLGMFTIAGIVKSSQAGLPFWTCILLGAVTGSVGGVIRDLILNDIPLLFRKDLYATACIIGGFVYFGCIEVPLLLPFAEFIGAGSIILVRVLAIRFHLHMPQL